MGDRAGPELIRSLGPRDRLIAIDGLDGAGKTTAASAVLSALQQLGLAAFSFNYCSGVFAPLFAKTRDIASHSSRYLLQLAAFSYVTDALSQLPHDAYVICDRYVHSAHSYYLALPDAERQVPAISIPAFLPDMAFLLTCDDATRRARLESRAPNVSARKARTFTSYGTSVVEIMRQVGRWTEIDVTHLTASMCAERLMDTILQRRLPG